MKVNPVKSIDSKGGSVFLFAEGIVNTVREPLMVLDSELRVISVNESFNKYFEVDPSETVGKLIYDLGNHQWDIPTLKKLLENILPQSSVVKDFEVTHQFQNIGKKTLLLNAQRLDIKGSAPMILISINDITERKKTENQKEKRFEMEQQLAEELEISNEELFQTQDELRETISKLETSNQELEQFAYVASHDLQEPLRMVASFIQLLDMQYKDKLDDQAHEYIDFAVDGAKRMQELINDLLEFSRITSNAKEFQAVDLRKVLDEVLFNLEIVIEENDAVIQREHLPVIFGDSSQMFQVFQNLIGNAIKYRSEKTPKIQISVGGGKKDYWLFSIKDNGIGMEPEYANLIFEIFKRLHTKEEYEGTGIGLAITKRIVERHGGKIWVESEKGKGTTFYFTIPKN